MMPAVSLILVGALGIVPASGSERAGARSRVEKKPAAELQFRLLPRGPAVKGRELTLGVGITNAGDREVMLTNEPRSWLGMYVFSAVETSEVEMAAIGHGHAAFPGKRICYSDSAEIFRLKPGEEVVREVDVPTEKAPDGRVVLTVHVAVVIVTPGAECEPAVVVEGRPSAEILVQPAATTGK